MQQEGRSPLIVIRVSPPLSRGNFPPLHICSCPSRVYLVRHSLANRNRQAFVTISSHHAFAWNKDSTWNLLGKLMGWEYFLAKSKPTIEQSVASSAQ